MRVVFQPAARFYVIDIYGYYLDGGVPDVAERFLTAVEQATENVRLMPQAGSPRFFPDPALEGLRTWPVPRFRQLRLYYLTEADPVKVVRVLHDKRDVASILG